MRKNYTDKEWEDMWNGVLKRMEEENTRAIEEAFDEHIDKYISGYGSDDSW